MNTLVRGWLCFWAQTVFLCYAGLKGSIFLYGFAYMAQLHRSPERLM